MTHERRGWSPYPMYFSALKSQVVMPQKNVTHNYSNLPNTIEYFHNQQGKYVGAIC